MIDVYNTSIAIIIGLLTSGIYYYRQRKNLTSAEKERIKRSNEKIENTILREMIRDNRNFSLDEIKKLIIAQASIDELNVNLLKSYGMIVNEIFYKIVDNEYIEPNQKNKLLSNIKEIANKINQEHKERKIREFKESDLSISPPLTLTIIVGFLAIIISSTILFFGTTITIPDMFNFILIIPLILLVIMAMLRFITRDYF